MFQNSVIHVIRTRLEEQQEFQRLNDHLRVVLQRNRVLDIEIDRLKEIIAQFNDNLLAEKQKINNFYSNELEEMRNHILGLVKERAAAEDECKKLTDRLNTAEANIKGQDRLIKSIKNKNEILRDENERLKKRIGELEDEMKQKDRQHSENLRIEKEKLVYQAEESAEEKNNLIQNLIDEKALKKKMEDEIKDNRILIADLLQKNELLKQQMRRDAEKYLLDTTMNQKKFKIDIPDIDLKLIEEWNRKCQMQLDEIRDKTEKRVGELQQQMEEKYGNEINSLKDALIRANDYAESLKAELLASSKIHSLKRELETQVLRIRDLEDKLKATENELNNLRKKYGKDIEERNKLIKKLENEKNELQNDFQKLFDLKISLERELEVYRNLLELEETRLKFLRGSNVCATLTANSYYSMTSGNNIVIAQQSEDCILVFNTSESDYVLPKNSVLRANDGNTEAEFQFSVCVKIKAGTSIKIFKNKANVANTAMEFYSSVAKWPCGQYMESTLLDDTGAIITTRRNMMVK